VAKKSSSAEVDRRIGVVVRMIVNCKRRSEIMEFAKIEWGVGRQTVDAYIARARAVLKEDYSHERADFIASKLSTLEKVVTASIECGQHSNAVGAIRLMSDLIGAFPDKK
jgi:hypothetical protein